MNVFISGSIKIQKLPLAAIQKIESIILKGYTILIGDAYGADYLVQKYLFDNKYYNVIIYFAGEKIRNNIGNWEKKAVENTMNKKGRDLYTIKDIEMAKDADCGLMIWDGKSKGTLNNIIEMKKANKRFYVVLNGNIIEDKNIDEILDNIKIKQPELEIA